MSVQDSILTAVTTTVSTATGIAATRREAGKRWETADPLPVIFVYPGIERDVEDCMENTKLREYQVFVEAIYAGNQGFQTNQETVPDIKQTIRRALNKTTLSGVSGAIAEVWDTRIAGQVTFNPASLAANYERTITEIWYSTTETRSA